MTHSPKTVVGIVTVSFNKAEYMTLCLDAILRAKNQSAYKVIVVDNASEKDEALRVKIFCQHLKAKNLMDIDFIQADKNLGFSAGNNVGLKQFFSDTDITHICLLNNDTIVTDYWLDDLVAQADKLSALVGPVSNSVGNEQVVPVDYKIEAPNGYSTLSVQKFAEQWRSYHLDHVVPTQMLGFFCVLGSINLFKKVGLLDEAFGIGTYEDDDYCFRAKKLGFRLKIVRHCFVHHWGSLSFSAIQQKKLRKLYARNRKIFESKHKNNWEPPAFSLSLAYAQESEFAGKHNKYQYVEAFQRIAKSYTISLRKLQQKIENPIFLFFQLIIGLSPDACTRYIVVAQNLTQALYRANPTEWKYIFKRIYSRIFGSLIGTLKSWGSSIQLQYIQFTKKLSSIFSRSTAPNQLPWIIFFSNIPFKWRVQRPHHIFQNLAKTGLYNVLWIDNSPARTRGLEVHFQRKANIYYARLPKINFKAFYNSAITANEATKALRLISKFIKTPIKNTKVIIAQPFWTEILTLANAQGAQTIYDCMDLHEGFSSATEELKMYEDQAIRAAQNIIVPSRYLVQHLITKGISNEQITRIPNGCDPQNFKREQKLKSNISSMRVGYFGAIAEWFDFELVAFAANRHPHIQFDLIGDYSLVSKQLIKDLPSNIIMYGEIPYSKLNSYTQDWRLGMIPFKLNELILATNPVKLYEYAALGLPTVATKIPEVMHEQRDFIFTAGTADEFSDIILKESTKVHALSNLTLFASENSWVSRSLNISKLLK